MILTSKHTIQFSNTNKKNTINDFINEYRRVAFIILNDIWNNGYKEFNIKTNLEFPKYIDYNDFKLETTLTARALSSLVTQLSGIIRASVEKQRKRLYVYNKSKESNVSKTRLKHLIKAIKQNNPKIPNVQNINPELSSKCATFIKTDNSFNGFIKISSILKNTKPIHIPIKYHKHSNSLSNKGIMKGSFLINKSHIEIRWDVKEQPKKETGLVVGADQGMKTVLSMATTDYNQTTNDKCKHGHSLESILYKLSRKQKGSKSFKRAQSHRTNFTNYVINRLDFNNIKELRLERIVNIGYKNGTNRLLSHWTNTIIRDKVEKKSILSGVHFIEQTCTYRSQRCYCCGMVYKSNRKGKLYECKSCGYINDSDINAALNHSIDLPDIPWNLYKSKINRNGFYWSVTGFYQLDGASIESALNKNNSYS